VYVSDSLYFYAQNPKLSDACRRTCRLSEKDDVKVFVLPKGKAGKLAGSFIYKPMSTKATHLQAQVYSLEGKIRALAYSDLSPEEKSKTLHQLQAQLKYTVTKLKTEIVSLPHAGYIVVEKSD